MDKIFAPIKGRIIQFVEKQGIVKEEFYKKNVISSSNFKGKGAISEIGGDKIVNILTNYPEINAEWLLTGKEPMLKANCLEIISEQSDMESNLKRLNLKVDGLEYTLEKVLDVVLHLRQKLDGKNGNSSKNIEPQDPSPRIPKMGNVNNGK